MISSKVKKIRITHFIKRHKNRLKSIYLKNIENLRINSKYDFIFKQFYKLIKYLKVKIEIKLKLNVNIFFNCLKHLKNIILSRIIYKIKIKKIF